MRSIFDDARFNGSLFYPSTDVIRPLDGARDLRVEVDPGVRLHLRIHAAPDAAVTLLLFHGNGETVSDYDSAASSFAQVGASLAVVDYRGYGASEGTPTLRDALRDAHAVLRALSAELPGQPLLVMGRSLGGACAAELCQTARPEVRGYVFESAPGDILAAVRRRGIEINALPEADLADFCPLRKLRRCETPSLVLHGERDTLIPLSDARASLEALAARDKTLVAIPHRGHNDVSLHLMYWDALRGFIARVTA